MNINYSNGMATIDGDSHVSVWARQQGRIDCDQPLMKVLQPFISEGGLVIDVGAMIGDHTVAYKKMVGPHGTVIAFEPNPLAYTCLVYNSPGTLNFNLGLGEDFYATGIFYNENVGGAQLRVDSHPALDTVHVIPLDALHLPRLDFMKIDVEGFEPFVLQGAHRTIAKHKPVMYMEVNDGALKAHGFNRHHILDWLNNNHYIFTVFAYGGEKDVDIEKHPQFDIICRPSAVL